MQATIIYTITTAAQRAAMASTGQPVPIRHVLTEDVPAALAASRLAKIAEDGAVTFDLSGSVPMSEEGKIGYSTYANVPGDFDSIPASGLDAINLRIAAIEAKSAELRESYAIRQVENAARVAEREAQLAASRADDAARKVEYEAKDAAKREHMAAWIAAQDDPALSEQFAAGLLSREYVLSRMAASAFAQYGLAPREPETCRDGDCPCCNTRVDTVPPEIYREWREIAARLPEGHAVEFRQVRECEGDLTAGDLYYAAVVTIPDGPFKFETTVKLG